MQGTTTPRTYSARPLPFNKLKGLHSQRVPPAVVKVPPYLTGPVDWDLELPVYESRFGKLLLTAPGEAVAKPKVPTSNLALVIMLLQDRAKCLRKQQSVPCSVSLDELELVSPVHISPCCLAVGMNGMSLLYLVAGNEPLAVSLS